MPYKLIYSIGKNRRSLRSWLTEYYNVDLNTLDIEALHASMFSCYILLLALTIIIGYLKFFSLSNPYKYLVALVTFIFIAEIIGKIYAFNAGTNFPIYNIILLLQFCLYPLIFKNIIINQKVKYMIIGAGITLGLFFLFNCKNFITFPSKGIMALSIYIIFSSLVVLYQMLQNPSILSPVHHPDFWFATANIIFFSTTFLFFGVLNHILRIGQSLPEWGYYIIWIANMVFYSLYLVTILANAGRGTSR